MICIVRVSVIVIKNGGVTGEGATDERCARNGVIDEDRPTALYVSKEAISTSALYLSNRARCFGNDVRYPPLCLKERGDSQSGALCGRGFFYHLGGKTPPSLHEADRFGVDGTPPW